MNRRNLLAALGTIGVATTAGCSSVGSTAITNVDGDRTDDGDVNLNFRTEDGTDVATLTVMPGKERYSGHGGGEVPVKIALTHGDATTVESLRLDLRAPPSHTGGGSPAAVSFTTPFAKPHPSIELYTDPDDLSTVLEIPDTEKQGDGTMVFDFLLTGLREETVELGVDTVIELSESGALGQEYTLEGQARVRLPDGMDER